MQFLFGEQMVSLEADTDLLTVIRELTNSAANHLGGDTPALRAGAIRDMVIHGKYEEMMKQAHDVGMSLIELIKRGHPTPEEFITGVHEILGPLPIPVRYICPDFLLLPMGAHKNPGPRVKLVRILSTLMTLQDTIRDGTAQEFAAVQADPVAFLHKSVQEINFESEHGKRALAEAETLLTAVRDSVAADRAKLELQPVTGVPTPLDLDYALRATMVEALTARLHEKLQVVAAQTGAVDDADRFVAVVDIFRHGQAVSHADVLPPMEVWRTVVRVLDGLPEDFWAEPRFKMMAIFLLHQRAEQQEREDARGRVEIAEPRFRYGD